MSGFGARFLLTFGTLASLLGISPACRAEKPAPWRRGPTLLHLAAAREALSPASSRHWGLSYPVDEMYAGPWANSPFAHGSNGAQARAGVVSLERGAPPPTSTTPAALPGQGSGRMVESALNGLGPLGILASALIPAVVASSASAVAGGGAGGGRAASTSPRVGFAKLASGYGVVVSDRFF